MVCFPDDCCLSMFCCLFGFYLLVFYLNNTPCSASNSNCVLLLFGPKFDRVLVTTQRSEPSV